MLGLRYIIQYTKGKENMAVDALSRKMTVGIQLDYKKENDDLAAIITITPTWYEQVYETYERNELFKIIVAKQVINMDK